MSDFKITVKNNGPLRLEGDITVFDESGKAWGLAGRTVSRLCRCSGSADEPSPDGSPRPLRLAPGLRSDELRPKPKA